MNQCQYQRSVSVLPHVLISVRLLAGAQLVVLAVSLISHDNIQYTSVCSSREINIYQPYAL